MSLFEHDLEIDQTNVKNRGNYVFISYSSQNQQMADSVRLLLIEQGISCWMAPYDIPAGSRYAYVINDALENCSGLVLLLTKASQESQFVEREIERAITYKKPIIPVQLEDLELNSGFKFYIGNSQIIAVPEIRKDSAEFMRVLSGIGNFVSKKEILEPAPITASYKVKRNCRITVFSPVNVDVFLNDKSNLVMKVDRNSGFDYKSNTIVAGEKFTLIFVGKKFEKKISFDMPDSSELEYHLKAILSKDEIEESYDRDNAIKHIRRKPSGYAFEQIACVGEKEDIDLLHSCLKELASNGSTTDTHTNYLIACCANALGSLCIKWHSYEASRVITKIYEKYPAKKSYGYMFESVMKKMLDALNREFAVENSDLIEMAEKGNADAQFDLAIKYYDKNSVYKDNHKAFQCFLKAAEGGSIQAMLKVASFYYVGIGCEKDTAKEQYWYRCAMEAGSTAAIYLLAQALDHGYLDHGRIGKTAEEKAEALKLYAKASEYGYIGASKDLAFHYLREKDNYQAFYWFRVAAEQGDSEGQLYYAKCLFWGDEQLGIPPQHPEAIPWYQKAAEQGDSRAQYALARCFYNGTGIEKDLKASFQWCEKAAKQDLQSAQLSLSIMYGRGLGTEQDSNQCECWYRAANKLESEAAYKKYFIKHVATLAETYPVFDEAFDW